MVELSSLSLLRYRRTLSSFRGYIHLLGGFWIVIGSLSVAFVTLLSRYALDPVLVSIVAGVGGVWLVLGICACMKQMWAVYVGLVLSYISLLGNLLQMRACALIIVIAAIFVAHTVISKASQLRRAGIPLNTRSLGAAATNPLEGINFEDVKMPGAPLVADPADGIAMEDKDDERVF